MRVNRILKWVLIYTCLFLLIFSVTAYADASMIIDLETAKKLALENNRALAQMKVSVDKTKVGVDTAEDAYTGANAYATWKTQLNEYYRLQDELQELIDSGAPADEISTKQKRIASLEASISITKTMMNPSAIEELRDALRDADDAFKDMQRGKEDFEQQLEYTVEQLYTNILKQQNTINMMEKSYELKTQQLFIERIKKDLGLTTTSAIDSLAVEVSSLFSSIRDTKNALKIMQWKFNDMLGRNLEEPLNLKEVEIEVVYQYPEYNSLLEKLNQNYAKVSQLKRDIDKKTDDLDDDNIKDDDNKKALTKLDIKDKELQLENEKVTLQTKAQSLIDNIKSKIKAYQLAEISYNTAKQTYEWDKKKYELGMISKLQLDASEMAYLEAANKKEAAGYDYFLAKHEIELAEQGILLSANSTEL